jgi:hypothetical protein
LFNKLAFAVGAAEINLEEPRKSLKTTTDRTVSIWVNLARLEMLRLFGTPTEVRTALDQGFRLFEPESGAATSSVDA